MDTVETFSGARGRESENTEHAVSFQFAVTWLSLFTPPESEKPTTALVPTAPRVPVENRGQASAPATEESPQPPAGGFAQAVLEEPPRAERPKAAAGSEVNWEMVIPKMVRPANRAAPVKEAPASRPLAAPPTTASTPRPASSKAAIPPPRSKPTQKPAYVVTEYQIPSADTEYFPSAGAEPSSFVVNLVLVLVAVVVLAAVIWIGMRPASAQSVQVESALGQRGWVRQHAPANAGGRQDRRLILFRPSVDSNDADLEFLWNPTGTGIGWAVRARDASNYYGTRLRVLGSGRSVTLAEERFTVVNGKESPHYEKLLTLPAADSAFRVKMSVVGPTFTLYLQGESQDTWMDATLATGGLGFLEERNEPVEAQSVRLAYTKIPPSNFGAILQALKLSFK